MFYIFLAAALAVATESITELVVKSVIFQPARDKIHMLSNDFLSKVISCGYCFSVWASFFVTFLAMLLYEYEVSFDTLLIYFIGSLVVHRLSNYLHNFNDKHLDKFYSIKEG